MCLEAVDQKPDEAFAKRQRPPRMEEDADSLFTGLDLRASCKKLIYRRVRGGILECPEYR